MNRRKFLALSSIALSGCAMTINILPARIRTASASVQVDPVNGNDTTGDLTHSFLTIAAAYCWLRDNIDCLGQPARIYLVDGTHQVGSGVAINYSLTGSSLLDIVGNLSNPGAVTVNCNAGAGCFSTRDGAIASIRGMRLTSTGGAGFYALTAQQISVLDWESIIFGKFGTFHCFAQGASMNQAGNYAIEGGCAYHIYADQLARVTWGNGQISIDNIGQSLAFSQFMKIKFGSNLTLASGVAPTWGGNSNALTGSRYSIENYGSVAQLSSLSWPANLSAGTTDGKGQIT